MKRLPSILLLLLASIIMLSLQSCSKPSDTKYDCSNQVAYYHLSDAQKKILPYTGFDTLNMVSNMGDTIHCIGTGKQFFYELDFEPYANPACGNHGTEKYYEAYKILFIDSVKNMQIELIHYDKHKIGNRDLYDDISIKFKTNIFYINDYQISSSTSRTYLGNINVNGKIYNDVSRTVVGNNYEETDSSSFTLINKYNGILKIQLNPTEMWTILN